MSWMQYDHGALLFHEWKSGKLIDLSCDVDPYDFLFIAVDLLLLHGSKKSVQLLAMGLGHWNVGLLYLANDHDLSIDPYGVRS